MRKSLVTAGNGHVVLLADGRLAGNLFKPVYIVAIKGAYFIGSVFVDSKNEFFGSQIFHTPGSNLRGYFPGVFHLAQA